MPKYGRIGGFRMKNILGLLLLPLALPIIAVMLIILQIKALLGDDNDKT